MFKLKLFILFALAGLCFGDSSGSDTVDAASSNGEAAGDAGGSETAGNSERGQEGSVGGPSDTGGASDNQQTEPQETETPDAAKETTHHVGEGLPEFLGNLTARKSYALKLLSACDKEHNLWKINEKNITFQNCTYTCLSKSGKLPPKENRIPTGLVCNTQKDTCPETGGCPPLPLPSC
uniref:Putative ticsk ixostatin n=1 Tax=Ixodes ricinus TaxID=34613 RepID=A0A147BW95_IXORI